SVAATIGKGIVDPSIITPLVVFAALIGAVLWNIATWYYGLPSSSSHALIGGLAGAAVAKSGIHFLNGPGIAKIASSIVLSPLSGFVLGYLFMCVVIFLFFKVTAKKANRFFR